ncbi:ABC transporter permease [Ureibacillus sinduriensis]|uniref:ABC transporter n=1 Tax=Ureibacillus sinduriensis BLB-1 = JCM 15800 TaxID=1384057 RepID=A0A0A3HSI6_9BACL|nr:ABC transporter permease [Ureibacillus sinduriensis]KGR75566.1 ABC transporter [Ureibacillus sinduriensis BLB-1 = JCM 15800]
MNLIRIQAIFMKDYKEFSRNYAVSTMVLLPLIMAFIYNKTGVDSMQAYFLPINLAFVAVTSFVQCCLIAEEKERNTLRSLMLSPASLLDILLGKSLLVFSITALTIMLSIFLVGYNPANWLIIATALFLSAVFYIGLGTLCALFTKTILEASVAILPIMLIFSFGPFALQLSGTYPILQIAEWLPSAQIIILAVSIEHVFTATEILAPIILILVWSIIIWFFTIILYKKRMVD